jgi:hypothetical protein
LILSAWFLWYILSHIFPKGWFEWASTVSYTFMNRWIWG